ncbi:MAG TPA: aldolase/citrate lyase family protein [Caulobacteraceae bacterium]|nr:aldolase/citrate lyase family protein [Caulobacteraceae bacterium]
MTDIPRLNGVIRAWEQGKPAFASFAHPERQVAIEFSTSPYDAIVFEGEHNPWDANALTDAFQYLLNRKQILAQGTPAPPVTPIVRIPPNGKEMNQSFAKQALDRGAYGVVWPHITTAEEAYNAVAACRYPRPKDAPNFEPEGIRGDGPHGAVRFWGLTQQEYYKRADVWPLAPEGEILVMLMIEDLQAIENLDEILKVPGIGCCIIGEGDLSQELGFPRQYEHPVVLEAMAQIVAACKKHNIPVGQPHVTTKNLQRVLDEGYRFLMSAPVKSYPVVEKGRELSGR